MKDAANPVEDAKIAIALDHPSSVITRLYEQIQAEFFSYMGDRVTNKPFPTTVPIPEIRAEQHQIDQLVDEIEAAMHAHLKFLEEDTREGL